MTMLASFGIASAVIVAEAATFYASMLTMDKLRLWHDAGLGAFIPMLFWSAVAAICAGGFVAWGLS